MVYCHVTRKLINENQYFTRPSSNVHIIKGVNVFEMATDHSLRKMEETNLISDY